MRILIAVVVVAALGWSAFWLMGARAVDRGWEAWVAARNSDGWVAHADDVRTSGFPNRFDTTLTGVDLADPKTGLAWRAPFFQVFRLSYEPRHMIVVWPETQTISTPEQRITIGLGQGRGSLVFGAGAAWPLERSSLVFEDVALSSNAGWTAELDQLLLALRPSERVAGAVNIGLDAQGIKPASAALERLAEAGLLPGEFEYVSLDASVTFDAAWDRLAIEEGRPRIEALDLHVLKSKWGALELWLAGELTVDGQGRPSGELTVKATNWREMLGLATGTGWLPEPVARSLETGLGVLARLAGARDTLDVPLTIRDGRIRLGPVPLGQAPRIRLR